MQEATLVDFLRKLDLWPLKYSGNSCFKLKCLYRHSRHEGGEDRRPSAIVSFDNSASPSWFTCFGCGASKPFLEAVSETAATHDIRWARLASQQRAIEDRELQDRPLKRMEPTRHTVRNYSRSLKQLLQFTYPDDMVEFLDSKGVSVGAAQDAMIAYMPEGYLDDQMTTDEEGNPKPAFSDMIVIPTIVPYRGKLRCVGAQARPWKSGVKYYTPYPYEAKYHLWGQQWLEEAKGQPLFVTEGQFDALHLRDLGAHAVSLMGVALSHPKVIQLRKAGPGIILPWLDPDTAGRGAMPRIKKALDNEGLAYRLIEATHDPKYCSRKQLTKILDSL